MTKVHELKISFKIYENEIVDSCMIFEDKNYNKYFVQLNQSEVKILMNGENFK